MRKLGVTLGFAAFAVTLLGAADQLPHAGSPSMPSLLPATEQPPPAPQTVMEGFSSGTYLIRYDRWTDADERGFGEFLRGIGESDCRTVNGCLHSSANPFHASDPEGLYFRADCADLAYDLRAYYAWKRGLPFSYVSDVRPVGRSRDIRYSRNGNSVAARHDILSGAMSGYALMDVLRDEISSATFRIHPDIDDPVPDFYSPVISPKSIRAGTVIYDPNGHVATVYRVDPDGRINYVDAHPDNSMTRGFYDIRFVRSRPGMGAGFKNWRSAVLVGATRRSDGVYVGGHIALPHNAQIADFSDEQYFGNGPRPPDDSAWGVGSFRLNGQYLDYYDFVRATLAGGRLEFDPVKEIHDLVDSNCADLHYRGEAVDLAIEAGLQNRPQPDRLPANIYGADGDWETYSTPSRDARLKTAFKELRDEAQRFVTMYRKNDPKLVYRGNDLVSDLIATYDQEAAKCSITYARTDGSRVTLGYDDARRRLFLMSFDPYHCVERRWGATDANELSTCRDGALKQAWYAAEQKLRNQIDRTYDAQMDFTLSELRVPGPGKGVAAPPDTDVRAYLVSVAGAERGEAASR